MRNRSKFKKHKMGGGSIRHNNHQHLHGHLHQPNDDKLLRIIRENLTLQESQLTDEEKWRLEHLRLHEKHKGHEEMHAEMVLILLTVTIFAQVGLVAWKKHHFKSYQFVSMLGVWLIPFIISLNNHYWRFVFVWLVFSSITSIVVKKALDKPIQPSTPRQVYKWFWFIYKICCGFGIFGYVVMMATFLGINFLFGMKPNAWMDLGFIFIFYGLYYGVLGRDLAEVCADRMASHIGYYKAEGMPTRTLEPGICAVCGNPQLVPVGEEGIVESTYKLSCGHTFHEFCIRGWCIVGKKQTCPYCKEKVDLKRMFCNPWEKPHVFYGQLLDWIRLLVAWQPIIIVIVQGINNYFGLQ